jgi:peptidoglycan/xylan/chitin deacetylase (PgdA/CDA1 family)
MPQSFGLISKLSRKLVYANRDFKFFFRLDNNFFEKARGARILIYHGICEHDHTRFNPIFLTKDMFEQQLKLFKKFCNLVTLDEYYGGTFSNDRLNLCLTFDDGFANNVKYALPLLEKYKVPAAFFITAVREAGFNILWNDFLGIVTKYGPAELTYDNVVYRKDHYGRYASNGRTLADILKEYGFGKKKEMMEKLQYLFPHNKEEEDYWLQMTREEIQALSASPFVTIGSHGYYHNRMDKISIDAAIEEMRRSRTFLEEITGKKIKAFAFPYGNYSRRLVEEARKLGYEQLLTMDFHFPEDANDSGLRERLTVNPFISANNQLHASITGQYE